MYHVITLPVGLPGQGLPLTCDPLSLLFACILAPPVLAVAVGDDRKSGVFWVFVAGIALALLAADPFGRIFGFGLMGAAAWLPRAHFAPTAGLAALTSGGMVKIALYLIIRYAFLVVGVGAPPWWGTALVITGAGAVCFGGLQAVLAVELDSVLAAAAAAQTGSIVIGLGIALRAKALGDAPPAMLALQAALLGAVAHGLLQPLLSLGAGAVKYAAGTTSLNGLGGLIRGMPKLGFLVLVGAAGIAALPFGPGFAPAYLLLHAVFAAAAGGWPSRIGFQALLAVLGLGGGLALTAAVRIIGIGFLGRPRSLRAAAAQEAGTPVLIGMALLAAGCLPLALAPGTLLDAMRPVLQTLVPGAAPAPLTYAPFPLAVLLALCAGTAWAFLKKFSPHGARLVPGWTGGFGKPPAWLPFGDPVTQPSATGFSQPLAGAIAQAIGGRHAIAAGRSIICNPRRRLRLKIIRAAMRLRGAARLRLAVVLGALVLALLAIGLAQA